MTFKRILSGTVLAAVMAASVPVAPALADGAASTRNILLGAGAAAYLIIQHNRKVHERYAEDARRQAALQSSSNDAWAAYSSEKNAYNNSLSEIVDLKREVAYQHNIIVQQRQQLAMAGRSGYVPQTAMVTQPRRNTRGAARRVAAVHPAPKNDVAMVSYGWGQL